MRLSSTSNVIDSKFTTAMDKHPTPWLHDCSINRWFDIIRYRLIVGFHSKQKPFGSGRAHSRIRLQIHAGTTSSNCLTTSYQTSSSSAHKQRFFLPDHHSRREIVLIRKYQAKKECGRKAALDQDETRRRARVENANYCFLDIPPLSQKKPNYSKKTSNAVL